MNKKVVFLHPDLGIGGAERAIIDAAVALKNKKYNVSIYTNHHDEDHCFEETINGDLRVIVVADFIPRSIFGRFSAFFAYLRFFILSIFLILFDNKYDLIYIDQISAPIPLLKLFKFKVLFYAHYPDMLLSKPGGLAKQLYRLGLNALEKLSLSYADVILYNSVFTSGVYRQHFPFLRKVDPIILYPVPNVDNLKSTNTEHPFIDEKYINTKIFLSINRYERKKNIELALKAFVLLNNKVQADGDKIELHFIHFGGFDDLVIENKEVYDELQELTISLGIESKVSLLKSCSNNVKINLLKRATVLLYTPSNEHFGIVPIEAMYLRCPVIAVNSGGPLETVIDNVTGYLCESKPEEFALRMHNFVTDGKLRTSMGEEGLKRVLSHFSNDVFQHDLDVIVKRLLTVC